MNYLADLGHRRIAHIDGDGGAGAAERRLGFERTMEQRGLQSTARVASGAYTEEGGREGIAALFDHGTPPTAVFVANDLAAVGALSALAERGIRVPEDVSIVGYDNTSLAALRHIDLTTVDQPRQDMGRIAVQLLLERLGARRSSPRRVVMPPRLVVRRTTAPPPPDAWRRWGSRWPWRPRATRSSARRRRQRRRRCPCGDAEVARHSRWRAADPAVYCIG